MASKLNSACDLVNCRQTVLWGPYVQNLFNNVDFGILSPGAFVGVKTELQGNSLNPISDDRLKVVVPENGKTLYDPVREVFLGGSRPISEYMDPNHNLIVAALFGCIPGVIYGLDKYRQIKCLYADCLQNAVGRDGLPVSACEDQKYYATCKYITGELFAVLPWTAIFDHMIGLVKGALSNPFEALGVIASIGCSQTCPTPVALSRIAAWGPCEGVKLLNQFGIVAENVKNIIDEGFKIREDYCSRVEKAKKKK